MRLELHPKQSEAFLSPATEILYGGAAGGGKSHLMRAAGVFWASAIPGLQVYLFRRLSDDLRKNHMEGPKSIPAMVADLVEAGHAKINIQEGTVKFWNGSKIFLCHCQYEKDVYKYQGAEIHLLLIDELTHFTRVIYAYLRGRVRMVGVDVPKQYQGLFPRIICGANPGGLGHNWVKADFIDGAPPMTIRSMPASEGGMRRQYIPARLADNPSLAADDPSYVARLDGLGDPALVRAMKDGDWDIVAGGAFDDIWRRDKHVLPRFGIPASWRIDRSFDWGSSKPFSVGWWAESDGTECVIGGVTRHFPRGTLVRVHEYYGWNGTPNEGCKMLAVDVAREILRIEAEVFPGRKVHPGPADSAIYAVENGTGIAQDMEKAGVRWTQADKRPGSRKSGFEAVRKRMKAALASPMEEPGLFVTDNCVHFIRTIPVLPRYEKDSDDIDTKAEDHCVVGDTIVQTANGPQRIADMVGTEGLVFTVGAALAEYDNCRMTRKNAPLVTVVFENGETITCTKDHLFLTQERGFVEAQHLCRRQSVCALNPERSRSFWGCDITAAAIITSVKGKGFIGRFGCISTVLSLPDSMSTTLTTIGTTIKSRILSYFQRGNTFASTRTDAQLHAKPLKPRESGMQVRQGISGTKSSTPESGTSLLFAWKRFATNVGNLLSGPNNLAFAQTIANRLGAEKRELMISTAIVRSAVRGSESASTAMLSPVPENAAMNMQRVSVLHVNDAGTGDVYCMRVAATRCFAAGESGVIIHNCYDEVRYRCTTPKSFAMFGVPK